MAWFKVWIRNVFCIDLRSLALFRILSSFLLITDIIHRFWIVDDFYTDSGVLPRWIYLEKFANPWKFSIHLANGQSFFIYSMLFISLIFACGMLIGYKTKICTFLSWLLMISLQVRNPVILSGADDIFRLILFWSLFVPTAHIWSLDSILKNSLDKNDFKDCEKNQNCSLGTSAFILQFLFMYIFTSILKNHPIWISEGSAVLYTLQIDLFTTPLAQYLILLPQVLLKFLTFGVLGLEFVGPFLFLLPTRHHWLRQLIVFSFIIFHFGLSQTMYIGIFPWLCMIIWIALLPGPFWSWSQMHLKIDLAWQYFNQKLLNKFYSIKNEKTNDPTFFSKTLFYKKYRYFLTQFLCLFFLVLVTIWNIVPNEKIPPPFWHITTFLQLNQKWDMFAPYPWREDGWFVVDATLNNEKHIDPLRNGNAVDFTKPKNVADTMPNSYWRKYMVNIWNRDYSDHRLYFGKYLCRKWNNTHPESEWISTFKLYYQLETTPGPTMTEPSPQLHLLWEHFCNGK